MNDLEEYNELQEAAQVAIETDEPSVEAAMYFIGYAPHYAVLTDKEAKSAIKENWGVKFDLKTIREAYSRLNIR